MAEEIIRIYWTEQTDGSVICQIPKKDIPDASELARHIYDSLSDIAVPGKVPEIYDGPQKVWFRCGPYGFDQLSEIGDEILSEFYTPPKLPESREINTDTLEWMDGRGGALLYVAPHPESIAYAKHLFGQLKKHTDLIRIIPTEREPEGMYLQCWAKELPAASLNDWMMRDSRRYEEQRLQKLQKAQPKRQAYRFPPEEFEPSIEESKSPVPVNAVEAQSSGGTITVAKDENGIEIIGSQATIVTLQFLVENGCLETYGFTLDNMVMAHSRDAASLTFETDLPSEYTLQGLADALEKEAAPRGVRYPVQHIDEWNHEISHGGFPGGGQRKGMPSPNKHKRTKHFPRV